MPRRVGTVAVAVALVGGVAIVVVRGRSTELPEREARAFVSAWSNGDGPVVDRLSTPGSGAAADQERLPAPEAFAAMM